MVELDEATRQALLARDGPPVGANAEILASLRAQLGGPSGDGGDEPGDAGGDPGEAGGDLGGLGDAGSGLGGGAGQFVWAAKIVAATAGLTTAGLLALKLGVAAIAPTGEVGLSGETATVEVVEVDAAESSDADPQAEPASAEPGVSVVESTDSPDEFAAAPKLAPNQLIHSQAHSQAHSQPGPQANPQTNPDANQSSLAAELELVRAAKQARTTQPTVALAELERHREHFLTGVLAHEREALRIEVLCELKRSAAATKASAEFLATFPDSPLRARVIAACKRAGTDITGAGD